jgi:hypothetical protein
MPDSPSPIGSTVNPNNLFWTAVTEIQESNGE